MRTYRTFLLAGALLTAPPQAAAAPESRIIGGVRVGSEGHAARWAGIVSIGRAGTPADKGHICGGVRIAQRLVLTARHCVEDGPAVTEPGDIVVYSGWNLLGPQARTRSTVRRIFRSPGTWRESETAGTDLAILQLRSGGSNAPTMALANEEQAAWTQPGVTARVAGWGVQRDASIPREREFGPGVDALREVRLPLRAPRACADRGATARGALHMLCAGAFERPSTRPVEGRQACYGDSGGPLVVEDPAGVAPSVVAGIVSGGTSLECAGGLGMYADVRRARPWIDAVVEAQATGAVPPVIGFTKADWPNRHGILKVHPGEYPAGHTVAVEVREGPGDPWREIARSAAHPIDARLAPTYDGTGQIRIRIVRNDGVEGLASRALSVVTGRDQASPTDPRTFSARRVGVMHRLRWRPSRDDDRVLGYLVEQRSPRGRWQFEAWLGCDACWTSDRARPPARSNHVLLPGRRQFRIAAVDRAGNWSGWVESGVTTPGPNG